MTIAPLPESSRRLTDVSASTRRARATRRCTRWARCRWSCAPASSSASSARRAVGSRPCSTCSGLAAPTQGTVEFEGKPVAGVVPDGVGVVFQEDARFPWLTVEDNVAFGLRRSGVDAAEIRRRVDFAVGRAVVRVPGDIDAAGKARVVGKETADKRARLH